MEARHPVDAAPGLDTTQLDEWAKVLRTHGNNPAAARAAFLDRLGTPPGPTSWRGPATTRWRSSALEAAIVLCRNEAETQRMVAWRTELELRDG